MAIEYKLLPPFEGDKVQQSSATSQTCKEQDKTVSSVEKHGGADGKDVVQMQQKLQGGQWDHHCSDYCWDKPCMGGLVNCVERQDMVDMKIENTIVFCKFLT